MLLFREKSSVFLREQKKKHFILLIETRRGRVTANAISLAFRRWL